MHSIKFVWTLKEKAWSCENAMTGKHRSGDLAPTLRKQEIKQTKRKFYNPNLTLGHVLTRDFHNRNLVLQ